MKIRSIRYYLREATLSIFRNRLMAVASIITVVSCIFIVSISFCLASNLDYILEQMEGSINLAVYLKDDVPPDQVSDISAAFENIEHVKHVEYISADEALKQFKESMGDDGGITEGLEQDNPLPRTFNIEMDSAENQDYIVSELQKLKYLGIDDIVYDQKIVGLLTSVNHGIRIVSIIVIAALLVISVVIITNTIKITVNSRRTEIGIMKYIGATDWFIRWPFIIEGMLIGLLGAIIPLVITWFSYNETIRAVYANLSVLENLIEFKSVTSVFSFLAPLAVIMGVGIGIIGSAWSIRKHLKV